MFDFVTHVDHEEIAAGETDEVPVVQIELQLARKLFISEVVPLFREVLCDVVRLASLVFMHMPLLLANMHDQINRVLAVDLYHVELSLFLKLVNL